MLKNDFKRRLVRVSLTPLIDVVFILLLFFMLSSQFQKLFELQLLVQASQPASASPSDTPSITAFADFDYLYIDRTRYEWNSDELNAKIAQWLESGTAVNLGAALGSTVGDLIWASDQLRLAGLEKLRLRESER